MYFNWLATLKTNHLGWVDISTQLVLYPLISSTPTALRRPQFVCSKTRRECYFIIIVDQFLSKIVGNSEHQKTLLIVDDEYIQQLVAKPSHPH
jgi:hypothetical protein